MHNETRYFWYDPNTKTSGQKYTFEQLMYSFFESIRGERQSHYNWRTKESTYSYNHDPFNYHEIENFFHKIGHTDNDGYWEEKKGRYDSTYKYVSFYVVDQNFVGPIEPGTEKRYMIETVKYIRIEYPKVWIMRSRIMDNWGRTISSGFLKAMYKQYVPNEAHKKPELHKTCNGRLSKWSYYHPEWLEFHGYKFRQGSVPGIHRYKRRWRRREAGTIGTGYEKRQWYAAIDEAKECGYEYGTTFKVRNERSPKRLPYGIKHSRHSWRDYNWKSHSKKEKQWM